MEETQERKLVQSASPMVSRDAWIVAGAILLGSIVVSLALLSTKGIGNSATPTATPGTTTPSGAEEEVAISMDQVKGLFSGKNITFGKKDSKVVFVEFSDPSCPYCHVASGKNPNLNKQAGPRFTMEQDGGTYVPPVPEMKKLVDSGKASFVWVYQNGHGNGELGTKALYCAHEKKKFWEAHDLLMSEAGYKILNEDVKNDISKAGELAEFLKPAVSVADMKTCLESKKYDGKIAEDSSIAQSFGVSGTPGFFVNTKRYSGAYSFADMKSTVDEFLK